MRVVRWFRRHSFRLQLAAIVLLAEAILIAAVVWQARQVLDAHLREQLQQRVGQVNPLLNAALAVPLVQRDYATAQQVVTQSITANSLAYLVVADVRGRRIAAAGPAADEPLPAPGDGADGRRLEIRLPLAIGGEVVGMAQYGIPLDFLAAARRELQDQVLRIGVIGAAVSLFMLAPLGLWLTRRLRRLERAAGDLAAGDLTQRIALGGNDELASLANAFDAMAASLAEHVDSLHRSEERFYYAVRGSNDGLWDWDLEHGEYYLSPRWKEMIGHQPRELGDERETFTSHLHPDDRAAVEAAIEAHFSTRAPYDTEYRLRHRDGHYLWCRARGQAVWNERGEVIRFSGATTDISDQRATSASMQALLKENQALLDNAVVGIVHLRDGRVVTCNRRFQELFGIGRDELVGGPIDMIYPSPTVYEEIGRAAYATIDRGETYGFELSLRRRDGSAFWGHLSARSFDPADPAQGSIWIFTDESERHEALDAVLEAQAFSDAIINSLPGIFYLFSEDGRMLRWNSNLERELGYRRRDMARTSPYDLIAPEAREATRRTIEEATATGHTTAGESLLRTRDGRRIPYFLTANGVDIQGQHMIVGVGIDLTARKEAEEQVRELAAQLEQRVKERTAALTAANRELESFSYSVSHDLSAPLRGIDGFTRIIDEEYAHLLDDDGRHYLQRIRAATRRMQGIIDDMLSLSRISRNELVLTTVDLSQLAARILEELTTRQPERQVEAVIAPDLAVTGDANLLRLALDNLLRNAWKFTGNHPAARIELGVLSEDGQAVYFVRDDGAGFDMRYAAKLFREFQRLHPANEFEGTGIGLAIVSRVVSRHGGRIWAEAAVERGATFYFTLPGKAH